MAQKEGFTVTYTNEQIMKRLNDIHNLEEKTHELVKMHKWLIGTSFIFTCGSYAFTLTVLLMII